LPEPEKLLQFQLPEVAQIEAYFVRDAEGRILARTREELEEQTDEAAGSEGPGGAESESNK